MNRNFVRGLTAVCAFLCTASGASASEADPWSHWLTQFKPPDIGRPETVGNGSSRQPLSCLPDEPVVTPMLPEEHFGLTFKGNPQIFVDIAETSAKHVFVTFRSDATDDYHQAMVPISDQSGRVGFGLPDNVALTPGVTYEWSLTLVCGDFISLNDPIVTGWVHRTELDVPDMGAEITNSPEAMAQWLSENGYWYDLMDLVVDPAYYSRVAR